MAATMRTDVGKVRRQNEDAAWFDEEKAVFAVADGMGGHMAGEVASEMAIGAVRETANSGAVPGIAALREMVAKGNAAIYRHAQTHPECAGMGTTLSVLWRVGHYAYIAHVGDSRVYRLRNGKLDQITMDHSLVEEMVRAGVITKEEARVHPRRNVITRALGTKGDCHPDVLAADVEPGDLWLLCTDGLSGMMEDEAIRLLLTRYPLEEAADRLIQTALDAGGRDNVTLILYRCEEG